MFTCHVCGSNEYDQEQINEVFNVDGRLILVEDIPARVCRRCGEATFSRETAEAVRQLVHGTAEPIRSISLDVYAYA